MSAELGRGSFGVVYRAFDRERSCDVAIKLLQDRRPRSLAELRSELRARTDVHHPSLLQIYGLELDGDQAFLTMELVDNAVTFVDHVRGGKVVPPAPPGPDLLARLARATHALLSALNCLHAAGFVHRDIKPQNVLVDAVSGDLRLADFGLTAQAPDALAKAKAGYLYGTPVCLAPELLWCGPATPATDLYGVGAMLFEALTGRYPDNATTRPVVVPARLGDTLRSLVEGLICHDPKRRLDVRAASERLTALVPEADLPVLDPLVTVPFVGRARELDRFHAMLDHSHCVIWVQGPSGIGKTSFVEHALSAWRGAGDGVVLRGRCHPQEHVRFRAWDEIAIQLARHTGRERVESELATPELAALQALFPVFEATSDERPVAPPPDAELRRVAVAAFRKLLLASSSARRLVIWIDDLQWANDDSLALLADLLERGVGRVVWIFSCRHDGDAALQARLRGSVSIPTFELSLGGLDRADVLGLLGDFGLRDGVDESTLAVLAVLPMFAPDLATRATAADPATPDALVARRTAGLSTRRLRLLDLVAACPRPIAWTLLAEAVDRPSELFDDFLALRQAGLLRRSDEGAGACVWTYHDVIRETRLSRLPASLADELHRCLIRAHDEHAPDEHEVLAHHLERVGETSRAAGSLTLAAKQAIDRLAFASAATHFDRAFALDPALDRSWELQTRRAECDASRGLSRSAGERFQRAAALREQRDGPSATLDLRSRAARELIRCGQIAPGYELLRQLMRRLGTRLPNGQLGTLAWSAALRARLMLREPTRIAAASTPENLARLDALWTGCTSLSHINPALADVFLLRHLALALEVGDAAHLTRSLTFEAVAVATLGGSLLARRTAALMDRGRALCEARNDDYDWGWYWTSRAAHATFECDWPAAVEHAIRAESYFDRRGHGIAWERSVARIYRAIALAMIGDAQALRAVVSVALEDAKERDDPVAENGVAAGHPAVLRLFDDTPADDHAGFRTSAMHRGARWPEVAFAAPDYYTMVSDTERLLYSGRAREALSRLARDWPALQGSGLLRLRFVGIDARYLRARCHIRCLSAGALDRGERRRLLAIIADDMRRIARSGEAVAGAYAAALAACLAALSGDAAAAAAAYTRAAAAFADRSMRAHAVAAERAAAGIRRDPPAIDRADQQLAALGAARPPELANLLVPLPAASQPFFGG